MPLNIPLPIIYAITSGKAKTPEEVLQLVQAAVDARVPLFQIREKSLNARSLYDLTARAVAITRRSETRLLVNDRSDIARAAGADGVHLTTQSLPVNVVRGMYGQEFLIGVSTHSCGEALAAKSGGADFVVFGPVFDTESKRAFGEPHGLAKLQEVANALREFPVLAIGGITADNVGACLEADASGIAAIRLLIDAAQLSSVVGKIRSKHD